MIEMEVCHNRSCAIHFEGKGGEIKSFTNETLAKMLDVRRQWLNMSAPYKNFTDVAKESLRLIDDSSNFNLDGINGAYGDGSWKRLQKLIQRVDYRTSVYGHQ